MDQTRLSSAIEQIAYTNLAPGELQGMYTEHNTDVSKATGLRILHTYCLLRKDAMFLLLCVLNRGIIRCNLDESFFAP